MMASHAKRVARKTVTRRKTARRSNGSSRRRAPTPESSTRKWSQRVTQQSDALDLEGGVFTLASPRKIAASLKRSAERSKRRKADPYRSALSMLTFYMNRAGKKLPASRKKVLQQAKDELRVQFGRE
jgi:hypothetical protein